MKSRIILFILSLIAIQFTSCSNSRNTEYEYAGEFIHDDLLHVSQIICERTYIQHFNYIMNHGEHRNTKINYFLILYSLKDNSSVKTDVFQLVNGLEEKLTISQLDSLYLALKNNPPEKYLSDLYSTLPLSYNYSHFQVSNSCEYREYIDLVDKKFPLKNRNVLTTDREKQLLVVRPLIKNNDTLYFYSINNDDLNERKIALKNKLFFGFSEEELCTYLLLTNKEQTTIYKNELNSNLILNSIPIDSVDISEIPLAIKSYLNRVNYNFRFNLKSNSLNVLWVKNPDTFGNVLIKEFYTLKDKEIKQYKTDFDKLPDDFKKNLYE
jgi:hypothetical protein